MSTTTRAGSKGVPRADREELILAAATEHFARHGYAATTLAAVAAAAGITKPLVYSYFGPKDDLFRACAAHAAANLAQVTAAPGHPHEDPILARVRITLTALQERPFDWNLVYGLEVPQGPAAETLREHRRDLIAPFVADVRRVARKAGMRNADDVALLTDVLLGLLTTVVRWWQTHPESTVDAVTARCGRVLTASLTMMEEIR